MPQPISRRPFQRLDLRYHLGTKLGTFLHLLSGEFVTTTGLVRVRQISEGHYGRRKMTDLLKTLRRDAGIKPLRTRATYIKSFPEATCLHVCRSFEERALSMNS